MSGRVENEIKINNKIKSLLSTLPDYVSEFYYNIQISRTPLTCFEYLSRIKHFLNYINVDIKDVDDVIIGKYLSSLKYTNNKKTSAAYTKIVCTSLNLFFGYLYDKKIINNNPMKLIQRPKKKDNVKRYYLGMDDLNAILDSVKNSKDKWKERDYAILFLLMVTGMRRTALSEININDIDFKSHELTVIDKRDTCQIYNITHEMEEVLLEWINKRNKILDDMGEKNDSLFISVNGNRITDKTVYRVVQKYSQKSLGYKVSPHKLRASFTVLYYDKSGHDIEATRDAVGHKDASTTCIYINMKSNARKDAAEFMSKGLAHN